MKPLLETKDKKAKIREPRGVKERECCSASGMGMSRDRIGMGAVW